LGLPGRRLRFPHGEIRARKHPLKEATRAQNGNVHGPDVDPTQLAACVCAQIVDDSSHQFGRKRIVEEYDQIAGRKSIGARIVTDHHRVREADLRKILPGGLYQRRNEFHTDQAFEVKGGRRDECSPFAGSKVDEGKTPPIATEHLQRLRHAKLVDRLIPDCERKVRQVRRKPPERNNLGGIGAVPAIKIIT